MQLNRRLAHFEGRSLQLGITTRNGKYSVNGIFPIFRVVDSYPYPELMNSGAWSCDGRGKIVRLSLWKHPDDTIYAIFARCESSPGAPSSQTLGTIRKIAQNLGCDFLNQLFSLPGRKVDVGSTPATPDNRLAPGIDDIDHQCPNFSLTV
jgi:hypothetical protein